MLTIKTFTFNDIGVNTFVLSSTNNECVIIDPGCYTDAEKKQLDAYISGANLKVMALLITHCHIDHVLGIAHIEDTYKIGATIHAAGAEFLRASVGYASVFGFELERIVKAAHFMDEGDMMRFGDVSLRVVYTPGHADGSVCFICDEEELVFVGDVLFLGSIGRTDLPTGDFKMLTQNIKSKLFTLAPTYTVYPGHGPTTTIGYEKMNNPFLD